MTRKLIRHCKGSAPLIAILMLVIASAVGLPIAYDSVSGHAITPAEAGWGLEQTGEQLKLLFTIPPLDKSQLHLDFADERLQEMEIVKNNTEALQTCAEEYRKHLNASIRLLEDAETRGSVDGIIDVYAIVDEATLRHQAILEGVLEDAPEEAIDAIQTAITESQTGHDTAIEKIQELQLQESQ